MEERLDMQSPDWVNENSAFIAERFPNCVTETAEGIKVDFDLLKQELSEDIIEGNKERYRLEWPGKREAIVTANLPTTKTLRPVREDSVGFDNTENLYIEGDNLEVLKLLQESYLGKIKMIYIDPPYNTGNDFVYVDNYRKSVEDSNLESGLIDEEGQKLGGLRDNPASAGRYHSDWLSMIYPRIKLARNLLTSDGIIFISIDENEVFNLKRVCDEIFGSENYIESLVWKKRYGAGGGTKGFAKLHEYLLVYSKKELDNIEAKLSSDQIDDYSKKDEKYKVRGGYITQPLQTSSKGERANLMYGFEHEGEMIYPKKGSRWLWSKEKLLKAYENNEIVINKNNNGFSVRFKQYLKDANGKIRNGKPLSMKTDVFNQDGTKELTDLFGVKGVFDFPKPTSYLKYFLSFVINDNEDNDFYVLDFFSGSAPSADAVMQLNAEDNGRRKFIQIQLNESIPNGSTAARQDYQNIPEIGKERIRRAAKKIKEETGADIDYGFRVYRLDESNMQDVYYKPQEYDQGQLELLADSVKADRSADDLLAQVMLDWGLPLSLKIEQVEVKGKQVFKVAENSLYACFDNGIDEDFAKAIAKEAPMRIVFKDSGFKNDTAKSNVKQLLKQLSPETEMKVL